MKLNYWKASWPLDVAVCPCDVHFAGFLRRHRVCGKAIFHFGTGQHHVLGERNGRARRPNHILGVTASRREYQAYMRLVIEQPRVALFYKVLFADIYTLAPELLPEFDLVTLFHLCEFYDAGASAYAPLDDASLLRMLLSRLRRRGLMLFYRGSMSFDRARVVIDGFIRRGQLRPRGQHRSLLLYEKP